MSGEASDEPYAAGPTAGLEGRDLEDRPEARTILESRDLSVFYGEEQALQSIDMEIPEKRVTAMIGPSGCGKSTYLRCINRMNDLIDVARVEGEMLFNGKDVYDDDVDPVALRRRIGMVFQQPEPLPQEHLRQRCLRSATTGQHGEPR